MPVWAGGMKKKAGGATQCVIARQVFAEFYRQCDTSVILTLYHSTGMLVRRQGMIYSPEPDKP